MKNVDDSVLSFIKKHECSKSEIIRDKFEEYLKSDYWRKYCGKYRVINNVVSWANSSEGYYFYYFMQLRLLIFVAYLYLENGNFAMTLNLLNEFINHYRLCNHFIVELDKGSRRISKEHFDMLHSLYLKKYNTIREALPYTMQSKISTLKFGN